MPRMDEVLNKVSKARYISKLDLTKGYWQVPLDLESRRKGAFITPFGHSVHCDAIWNDQFRSHFRPYDGQSLRRVR
jgi:hypothetical protein